MKKFFLTFLVVFACVGCKLDPETQYYTMSKIENVTFEPELENITSDDDLIVSATITHHYGIGSACVKYWVCNNSWGEELPELKIENNILYRWVEPASEEESGEWKRLASMQHTEVLSIEADKPYEFKSVIPQQQAGKFVIFKIYFTNLYGFVASSAVFHYTVKP